MTTQKPANVVFAYVGSGANVDVLKFSHEKGLFKKRNLEMTLVYVADGVLSNQAVTSGRAAAATAPITDAISAIAKGAPLKIIMVNIDRFDYFFMAKSGINGLADLRGKKIAVSRKDSVSEIGTRFFLRQAGLDPDRDVEFLHLGNAAARAAALSSGVADSAAVTSSFVPVAKKAGLKVIFDMSTTQMRIANRSVVTSDRLIKDQPNTVKAIVAGFVEGTRYWKANPPEAKAYLKKLNKLPDQDIDAIYSDSCKFMRSEPIPDLDGMQNAWDSVPGHQPLGMADFRKFVDAKFVAEVLKGTT
jgi:NitT/TauT family transport system substrate-binding protein